MLVPSEAVIRTGARDVVIVVLEEGRFRATEVQVGAEEAGQSEIRNGLQAGARVVLSGQFLIESEASLSGAIARLQGVEKPAASSGHSGKGIVIEVDAKDGRVELDHDPMPSLKWPRMTMGFIVAERAQLRSLKPGDRVRFDLRAEPDGDGNYVISRIERAR